MPCLLSYDQPDNPPDPTRACRPLAVQATCKHSKTDVVLKIYARCSLAPDVAQHEMYREVAIQSSLQHPYIIHLFGAFQVQYKPPSACGMATFYVGPD